MSIFEENLKEAFSESQHALSMEKQKTDPQYQQLETEYKELFDRIKDTLGEKHKQLIFTFEELRNEIGSIDDDCVYLQGMIDCVKLLKMIRLI